MGKRAFAVVVCVLMLAGGALVLNGSRRGTTAAEDQVIPVTYVEYRTGMPPGKANGDPCVLTATLGNGTSTPLQAVVTNEGGVVIAVSDLHGAVKVIGGPDDQYACVGTADVAVPAASFYTVLLDGDIARTYRAEDFPLDRPDDGVYVTVTET